MVLTGAVLFILALYIIGSKQNLFGSTINVKAVFEDVNGLTTGNNVRYMGINIGTVNKVSIVNDSVVLVEMTIKSEAQTYLKKNAIASIGTDGLMGNKLINISAVSGKADYIESETELKSISPIDMDLMLRMLTSSNEEINVISKNLRSLSDRIIKEDNLLSLIEDQELIHSIQQSFRNIENSTSELEHFSNSLRKISNEIQNGDGLAGMLINDTTLVKDLHSTMSNLQSASDSLFVFSGDMVRISNMVTQGKGAAGTVLADEQFKNDLTETMENIKKASKALDENMEALKHSIFLRKYFKKVQKQNY